MIRVTPQHPFFSPDTGWVDAGHLKAGDRLLARDGRILIVQAIHARRVGVTVYNFEVAGDHDYYVSTAQLLVHNCDGISGSSASDAAASGGEGLGAARQAAEGGSLAERATSIHSAMPERTAGSTTTAVLQAHTASGEARTIVATSEQYFRSSWLNALREDEIAVAGPGHAELNALNAARLMGLQPTKIAASRPVCLGCQLTLRNAGVDIVSPLKEYPSLGWPPMG